MKTKSSFPLKLTQRRNIAILNSFQMDAERLIVVTKRVLQEHKFRTEEQTNSVHFIYPVGFTTHSGDNELAGMRTLRKGTIELIELPSRTIEIKSSINLKHLAIIATGIGLVFCFVGYYISESGWHIKLIVFSLILIAMILVIGRKSIKNRVARILKEIVEGASKST
ncbi:hypothetical protein [Zobellia roscoffensis]|uniref:hypothetical protein n=1 Tax=Zobellia roscoffensis TaxID=2779508 RepID=UPI00188D02FC|nr:hypothetical protein [Zobellia roscoffensis]